MEEDKHTQIVLIRENDPDNIPRLAEAIYRHFHRLVKHFLRVFGIPRDEQNDLFNQVFLNITQGLRHIKHFGNLKSWVVTITKNEIYNYIGRREREIKFYSFVDDEVLTIPEKPDWQSSFLSPERELFAKQLRVTFNQYLSELDNEITAPFLLRYRDGLKWREIGSALGINLDTARKRALRAKRKVLRYLLSIFGSFTSL